MSEILGHDVNGRPLRAGDRVAPTDPVDAKLAGHPLPPWTIAGHSRFPGFVLLEEVGADGSRKSSRCRSIRRLDDRTDHQPSEYTFDSLMDHLKSGVPA